MFWLKIECPDLSLASENAADPDGSMVATPIDGTAGRVNLYNSVLSGKNSRFIYLKAA
ncbi:hypothetical protein [Methylocystis sp. SC2]|uniref:hypothetical protein n=1 Tax=Methylocystis sp. (strain SC2) TaxID=187303 RepID=UPI0002F3C9F3|nr:hypothetical protein [Methylocystis sp. SC2]